MYEKSIILLSLFISSFAIIHQIKYAAGKKIPMIKYGSPIV